MTDNREIDYAKYDTMNLVEMGKRLLKLRDELNVLKEEKTKVQKEYDHLRLSRIPELMQSEDIQNLTIAGVGRIHLEGDLFISIASGQRQKAYEWLTANGYEDLIVETVNASTLKAAAKGWLRRGVLIPEQLFKMTPITRAKLTAE